VRRLKRREKGREGERRGEKRRKGSLGISLFVPVYK